MGRVYFVRVCAFTSVGSGPYSQPMTIAMDPVSLDLVNGHNNGITAEEGASQVLKEVWFIILMGCLLFIFLLLLIIILYTRRKSHGKKDHISSKLKFSLEISLATTYCFACCTCASFFKDSRAEGSIWCSCGSNSEWTAHLLLLLLLSVWDDPWGKQEGFKFHLRSGMIMKFLVCVFHRYSSCSTHRLAVCEWETKLVDWSKVETDWREW